MCGESSSSGHSSDDPAGSRGSQGEPFRIAPNGISVFDATSGSFSPEVAIRYQCGAGLPWAAGRPFDCNAEEGEGELGNFLPGCNRCYWLAEQSVKRQIEPQVQRIPIWSTWRILWITSFGSCWELARSITSLLWDIVTWRLKKSSSSAITWSTFTSRRFLWRFVDSSSRSECFKERGFLVPKLSSRSHSRGQSDWTSDPLFNEDALSYATVFLRMVNVRRRIFSWSRPLRELASQFWFLSWQLQSSNPEDQVRLKTGSEVIHNSEVNINLLGKSCLTSEKVNWSNNLKSIHANNLRFCSLASGNTWCFLHVAGSKIEHLQFFWNVFWVFLCLHESLKLYLTSRFGRKTSWI